MKITYGRGLLLIVLLAICGMVWLNMSQMVKYVRSIPSDVTLHPGDVILLGSSTWRGRLLKFLERDCLYVHTGILDKEDGHSYLVHADPSRNAVVRESLDTYLSSNKIECVMVMRVEDGGQDAIKAIDYARTQWRNARRFNNTFRYGEGDGLYCTELVLRAWQSAGVELLPGIGSGDKVFPSRLLNSCRLRRVVECLGKSF